MMSILRLNGMSALAAVLAAAAISAPARATPLSYFVNFTGAGPLPTTGLFTYDASTSAFSNFFVSWSGHLFDMTASANAPSIGGGCPGLSSSGATGFGLMTKSLCGGLYDRWFAGNDFGSSRFAFSSQTLALPEKNAASINATGPGSGTFPSTSAAGDWTLSAPFQAPGGTPLILADGTVVFPGGAVFIEGKGLVKVNYRVEFTGAGPLPTLGLFDYHAGAAGFDNFFVIWNGHFFDLTSAANAPSVGSACPGTTSTPATGFALLSKTLCGGLYDRWSAADEFGFSRFSFSSQTLALPELNGARIETTGPGSGDFQRILAGGDWSLTPLVAVPEPATSAMLLAGFALLAGAARRANAARAGQPVQR